ncbi:MAG: flagellar motor switch protein FliM [Deltaproteobacteria bacterium]|nr:flagellar motor switch protein FliM [Deltaproteobacteria bacterium]
MAEVLSQSEIDALLAAVSSGNVETDDSAQKSKPGAKASIDWVAYDLTTQEKVVRGRLAALQGINERFCRHFRATLSNLLNRHVTITVMNTEFVRFSDYLSNILLPASLNIIAMKNLRGYMILVVSSKLAYALVDTYYGGSERPFSKIGGREEFTNIETSMIKRICGLALNDLKEAWKLNYPLELDLLRSESNPHFVGAIHGSETVAVITFEVEFENLSGPFVVLLQLRALDPIQPFLNVNVTGEIPADTGMWRNHWLRELGDIEMNMKVEVGKSERTVETLGQLKKGDVLILDQDAAAPLVAYIEEVPKLRGLMGVCRGNTAIQVTELLPPKERGE